MEQQVAAKGVTVVDGGTPRGRNVLIEDGNLIVYMQDLQNMRLIGTKTTGNDRRES